MQETYESITEGHANDDAQMDDQQLVEPNMNTCSFCGEKGHNKRTCKGEKISNQNVCYLTF